MLASLDRLEALEQGGARIFFGHDPEFWRTVPQAPVASHKADPRSCSAKAKIAQRRRNRVLRSAIELRSDLLIPFATRLFTGGTL